MESTTSFVQFKPTSPALTLRYDVKAFADRATKSCKTIEPGLEPQGSIPLPQRWSTHVHPEGSRYFVYDSTPRIVTDTYMSTQAEFDAFLDRFVTPIQDFLKELAPHKEMEVYLRQDRYSICGYYYLVDHARQRISWLESVTTYDMDLLGATSDSNLELILQKAYWTHASYFPCHKAAGFDPRREELKDNLLSFRVDDIVSSTASVPYRSNQCDQLVNSIQNLEEGSPHETWVIARLWALLLDERVVNGYGEETARIDSTQLVHKVSITEPCRMYKLLSVLLLRLPDIYRTVLVDKLWRDSTVPGSHWSLFWDRLQWEWKTCLVVSCCLLMTNMLAFGLLDDISICAASLTFAFGAVSASYILMLLRHHYVAVGVAEDAYEWLSRDEHTGFSIISIALSLPRALTYWALITTAVQIGIAIVMYGEWKAWLMNLAAVFCILCLYEVLRAYRSGARSAPSNELGVNMV